MPVPDCFLGANVVTHYPNMINLYGCHIGEGTRIGTFVEIGPGVAVGAHCKIQTGAFIPAGVTIGDKVFIGPNATFCNTKHPMCNEPYLKTTVGDGAVIGANATILPGITIGERAIVGAGSVVTKDVPAGATVFGNPARVKSKHYDRG